MDIKNYAIGIGYNANNEAACLILSVDSIEKGASIAISADRAQVIDDDLYLSSGNEVLVLKSISYQCITLIKKGIPIVIIDPANQIENLIQT